jgi:hypothetical protein
MKLRLFLAPLKTTSDSTGSSICTSAAPASSRSMISSRSTRTMSAAISSRRGVDLIRDALHPHRARQQIGTGQRHLHRPPVSVRMKVQLVHGDRPAAADAAEHAGMPHLARGHVQRAQFGLEGRRGRPSAAAGRSAARAGSCRAGCRRSSRSCRGAARRRCTSSRRRAAGRRRSGARRRRPSPGRRASSSRPSTCACIASTIQRGRGQLPMPVTASGGTAGAITGMRRGSGVVVAPLTPELPARGVAGTLTQQHVRPARPWPRGSCAACPAGSTTRVRSSSCGTRPADLHPPRPRWSGSPAVRRAAADRCACGSAAAIRCRSRDRRRRRPCPVAFKRVSCDGVHRLSSSRWGSLRS